MIIGESSWPNKVLEGDLIQRLRAVRGVSRLALAGPMAVLGPSMNP